MISKYKISLLTSGLHFSRQQQFTNLLTTNLNLELTLTYNLNLKLHSTSRWSFHTRLFTGHPSSSSSKNSPGKGDHQRNRFSLCHCGAQFKYYMSLWRPKLRCDTRFWVPQRFLMRVSEID
jgi:hypothetical protein